MKNVFIINPLAGRHSAEDAIREAIKPYEQEHDCQVYVTRERGDAAEHVRRLCEQSSDDIRFYACGGDGTLNEVVNGAAGFAHAAVGAYPSGSGNDYVKYFGDKQPFLDVGRQLRGAQRRVDLMRVQGRYAINMVHFGLDAKVAAIMAKVRRWPFLGGRNAYITGVVGAFFQKLASPCQVIADGEALNEDTLFLCTVACGQYVGGGFRSSPRSDHADGLMDVCLIKLLPRLGFLGLVSAYKEGTHLEDPRLKGTLVYRQAREVRLRPGVPYPISMDGELITVEETAVELLPGAMRFIVPEGVR